MEKINEMKMFPFHMGMFVSIRIISFQLYIMLCSSTFQPIARFPATPSSMLLVAASSLKILCTLCVSRQDKQNENYWVLAPGTFYKSWTSGSWQKG